MATYKLCDDLSQKCVLGMALDFSSDVLRYHVKSLYKPMTRRGMLSELSYVLPAWFGGAGAAAWTLTVTDKS